MTLRTFLLTVTFIFSAGLLGCATMNDVVRSKNEGRAEVYPVKADQAWEIAVAVLRWEGCETIEEHRKDGYMLTTFDQSFLSSGCLAGVWVESTSQTNTKVTVVTKRKLQTSVGTPLTETTFQKRFAQAVTIVNAGKPLPLEPPPLDKE